MFMPITVNKTTGLNSPRREMSSQAGITSCRIIYCPPAGVPKAFAAAHMAIDRLCKMYAVPEGTGRGAVSNKQSTVTVGLESCANNWYTMTLKMNVAPRKLKAMYEDILEAIRLSELIQLGRPSGFIANKPKASVTNYPQSHESSCRPRITRDASSVLQFQLLEPFFHPRLHCFRENMSPHALPFSCSCVDKATTFLAFVYA